MEAASEMAYTVAELAHRWNCDRKTVRRLIQCNELKAFRLRREWRISKCEVTRYEAHYSNHQTVR